MSSGTLRQLGPNLWEVGIDFGYNDTGKRVRRYRRIRGTKKVAEAERTRLLRERDTGARPTAASLKVGEYLEQWLDDFARSRVSGKTLERYDAIVRRHLIPALGNHRLTKLSPMHIQGYYASALESGRLNGKGGLSPQTVLHHHRVLHVALKSAVKARLLTWNPCEGTDPPRPQRPEMNAQNEDDTARMLECLEKDSNHELYLPVLVAVTTGLRRGELLALRWGDLDFDAGVLSVSRSLEQTSAGLRFKSPKTRKGVRRVQLPDLTIKPLWRHRLEQERLKTDVGKGYQDGDLIFCMLDGSPWHPNNFSAAFARFAKRHNLGIRLHDLRHSHASQLLRQGVPLKVVSERLGHATAAITLDVYAHVLPGMQEEAARGLDSALSGAVERRRKVSGGV
ncbi:MAG: site-specific integrase [Actinomycetota bacterium]|nr:site-specific integrase [Actinomycetota bacterium]